MSGVGHLASDIGRASSHSRLPLFVTSTRMTDAARLLRLPAPARVALSVLWRPAAELPPVNLGVRGSEPIRSRVVQVGTLDVVGCILEAWLAGRGFVVGPSTSATGLPRESREARAARRVAAAVVAAGRIGGRDVVWCRSWRWCATRIFGGNGARGRNWETAALP
ncbi:hypothetical protein C8J57DRAFT_1577242 [Mycena rebaudengoi]|nr:hypothetical protein C8J57DRAFT_1577242 [Mycena rebaudengoi]